MNKQILSVSLAVMLGLFTGTTKTMETRKTGPGIQERIEEYKKSMQKTGAPKQPTKIKTGRQVPPVPATRQVRKVPTGQVPPIKKVKTGRVQVFPTGQVPTRQQVQPTGQVRKVPTGKPLVPQRPKKLNLVPVGPRTGQVPPLPPKPKKLNLVPVVPTTRQVPTTTRQVPVPPTRQVPTTTRQVPTEETTTRMPVSKLGTTEIKRMAKPIAKRQPRTRTHTEIPGGE